MADVIKFTNATELKPCPFCGGKAEWYYHSPGGFILCKKCKASTDIFELHDEEICKEVAFEAWNRRVGDTDGKERTE